MIALPLCPLFPFVLGCLCVVGLAACSVCVHASGVCVQLLGRGGPLALQDAAVMQLSNSQYLAINLQDLF